jgi:hypothetical protein
MPEKVELPRVGFGVTSAVLQTQLLPPQIRVRCSPDSRHDSDGPEQLRFVPQPDSCTATEVIR